MNDKYFFKEKKTIVSCKECGTEYNPSENSVALISGLCRKCRNIWFKAQYQRHKEYERLPHRKIMKFQVWKKWVIINLEKRRSQALMSYHRHKEERKDKRKEYYQRTKKPGI